ncbi:MAG: DUF4918 family protein, partial [Schleiferiaceae bacterium]|nr:DUF4918 family protein [Schleiferiaceae bacterium]
AYGGVESFYNSFYIGSVCPLGFTVQSKAGKEVNYNYYDALKLQNAVEPFIINAIEKQLEFGINKSKVFCLGTGKNTKYLTGLNTKKKWFEEVVPLEHPRYVMQYKRKALDSYIDKFIRLLAEE